MGLRERMAVCEDNIADEVDFGKKHGGEFKALEQRVKALEEKRARSEGHAEADRWRRARQIGKGGALVGVGAAAQPLIQWIQQLLGG